jgi:hypothetical protein
MAITIHDLAVSDFTVADQGGGVHIITPLTPDAIDWLARHLRDEAIIASLSVTVVEPEQLSDILGGIGKDGLTVAR